MSKSHNKLKISVDGLFGIFEARTIDSRLVFGGRKIVREAAEQADPSNAFESSGHSTQGARQRTHEAEGNCRLTCCIGFVASCLSSTRSKY